MALALPVLLAAAACGGGGDPVPVDPTLTPDNPTPVATPALEGETVAVTAPIRHISIESEGDPLQYTVFVLSAQTTDCEAFDGVRSVERDGQTVNIDIRNLRLVNPGRSCREVLREQQSRVPIGSDFTPGQTYTVIVNGFPESFTVPGGPPTPTPATPVPTPTPVPLGFVTVDRVTVLLQEVRTIGVVNFQALVLTKAGEFAEGATVSASLQGPVGSGALKSLVQEVITDDGGIADFRFEIEEGGSYVFTVEFVFGAGAIFDKEASKQSFVFTEIPPPLSP